MARRNGVVIISLDFELNWGAWDKSAFDSFREHYLGARRAVPLLLGLFAEYGIHATWAIVGFLFYATRDALLRELPTKRPEYNGRQFSAYDIIESVGEDEQSDPFHFAPSLVKMIASAPDQEIGSHTFSHCYCLAEGQDGETFEQDLSAACRIAQRQGLSIRSIVFPMHQANPKYAAVCRRMGITAHRGFNDTGWVHRCRIERQTTLFRRALRLVDTYVNISGHNCYGAERIRRERPMNIPASRFLRPFSSTGRFLEPARLRRILGDMTHAATRGLVYHLWWHPYNFGTHQVKNESFLRKILDHYRRLQKAYGMESLNMGELSEALAAEAG